ncbi:MAG: PucR family transcriptional regulator, partial [Tumebacillaceae bacterium]
AARVEAEFALGAGKRFRSRELIHAFDKLGLARLLHGVPHTVRDRFLQEVLPETVLHSLSPELRETIFAFLENGQQVADTARSLYIHRNTLQYRLERIHELTGYDIRKPFQGWTLWVALTLIRSL